MKVDRNSKLAAWLLIASGLTFFIMAAMMDQAAFSGVGVALLVVGAVVFGKKRRS